MTLIYNLPGIAMAGVAFGTAIGIGRLTKITGEGPLMLIASPLCILFDVAYRRWRPERSMFYPETGGSLFFLPVWALGIIWLALGAVYTVRGPE